VDEHFIKREEEKKKQEREAIEKTSWAKLDLRIHGRKALIRGGWSIRKTKDPKGEVPRRVIGAPYPLSQTPRETALGPSTTVTLPSRETLGENWLKKLNRGSSVKIGVLRRVRPIVQ